MGRERGGGAETAVLAPCRAASDVTIASSATEQQPPPFRRRQHRGTPGALPSFQLLLLLLPPLHPFPEGQMRGGGEGSQGEQKNAYINPSKVRTFPILPHQPSLPNQQKPTTSLQSHITSIFGPSRHNDTKTAVTMKASLIAVVLTQLALLASSNPMPEAAALAEPEAAPEPYFIHLPILFKHGYKKCGPPKCKDHKDDDKDDKKKKHHWKSCSKDWVRPSAASTHCAHFFFLFSEFGAIF